MGKGEGHGEFNVKVCIYLYIYIQNEGEGKQIKTRPCFFTNVSFRRVLNQSRTENKGKERNGRGWDIYMYICMYMFPVSFSLFILVGGRDQPVVRKRKGERKSGILSAPFFSQCYVNVSCDAVSYFFFFLFSFPRERDRTRGALAQGTLGRCDRPLLFVQSKVL